MKEKLYFFVSHNLAAVQKLCNKGLLLENGKLKVYNNLPIVLDKYLESLEVITSNSVDVPFNENSAAFAYRMVILDSGNNPVTEIPIGETWKIELYIKININVQHFICAVGLVDQQNTPIGTGFTMPQNIEPGSYKVVFQCNNIMLASGLYNIYIGLSSYERSLQSASDFAFLRISDVIKETHKQSVVRNQGVGVILNLFETNILNVND